MTVDAQAIILAAGASRRMGRPKALVELAGGTFLRLIERAIRDAGIDAIVLVLGAEAERVRAAIGWFGGRIAVNERWRDGQLSSLLTGLDAWGPMVSGPTLVWPVDRPLVSSTLVRRLLEAEARTGSPIVVPTFAGRRGHPVLFGPSVLPELRRASPALGARDVLRRHPSLVHELATEETAVLRNLDTPADLGLPAGN